MESWFYEIYKKMETLMVIYKLDLAKFGQSSQ
jgi:hypothetical protein